MIRAHAASAIILVLVACPAPATAQVDDDPEPLAIVEVGVAPSWSISGSPASVSPTVAVETTPIEDWLEIEIGTTPTFRRHSATEWDTDLLFKKPWTLSKKVEFMLGAGPVWIHAHDNGVATNAAGLEVALDFMFWPVNHRFGWYLEPAYQHNFGRNHEQSAGFSAGILIAIRR